jgi:hypothetical protein
MDGKNGERKAIEPPTEFSATSFSPGPAGRAGGPLVPRRKIPGAAFGIDCRPGFGSLEGLT